MFLRRRFGLSRVLRRLPGASDELLKRVTAVAARVGLTRPPRTRIRPAGASPFVCGVFRPTLVLPADFSWLLTPAQQDVVLAHECGHLAGRDPLWTAVSECVAVVVWWNPPRLRSPDRTAVLDATL